MNYAVIRHADGKKSKSKYQGGFKNGKNTSAYNHDYYIHNKEKWQDNQGDWEEELNDIQNMPDGPEKQAAYKQYLAKKEQAEKAKQNASPKTSPKVSKEYQEEKEYNSKKNDYSGKKPNPSKEKPPAATPKPKGSKEYQEEMASNSKENKPKTDKKRSRLTNVTQTRTKLVDDSRTKTKDMLVGPKEKEAIVNERSQMGKKKKYSIIDRLVGKPEYDNLQRAKENYDDKTARRNAYNSRAGYRMQTHTATKGQQQANKHLNTYYRTQEGRAKQILNKAQKDYDKTLHAKIEKGKAWLDSIFKDGRRK